MELAPYISRVAFVGPRGVLEQDRGVAHPGEVSVSGLVVPPTMLALADEVIE
jgi:hypothetical protein